MVDPEDIVPFTKVSLRCESWLHFVPTCLLTSQTQQEMVSEGERYLASPLARSGYY